MNRVVTKRYLSTIATITLSTVLGVVIATLYQQKTKLTNVSLINEQTQITSTVTQPPPKPEELIRDKQIEYFVNDVLSASPAAELANKTIIKADPITSKTRTDWVVEAFNPKLDDCPSRDYCNFKSYYYSAGKAVDVTVVSTSLESAPFCHITSVNDISSWRATWTANPQLQPPILFIQQTCNRNHPFYKVYQLIDFESGKLIPFKDVTGATPKNMIDSQGQVWGNEFIDHLPYGQSPYLLISTEKVESELSQKHNSYSVFRLNLGKHSIDKHSVF